MTTVVFRWFYRNKNFGSPHTIFIARKLYIVIEIRAKVLVQINLGFQVHIDIFQIAMVELTRHLKLFFQSDFSFWIFTPFISYLISGNRIASPLFMKANLPYLFPHPSVCWLFLLHKYNSRTVAYMNLYSESLFWSHRLCRKHLAKTVETIDIASKWSYNHRRTPRWLSNTHRLWPKDF